MIVTYDIMSRRYSSSYTHANERLLALDVAHNANAVTMHHSENKFLPHLRALYLQHFGAVIRRPNLRYCSLVSWSHISRQDECTTMRTSLDPLLISHGVRAVERGPMPVCARGVKCNASLPSTHL